MNSEAQDILAAIIRRELEPVTRRLDELSDQIATMQLSLGATNGQMRPLGTHVAELEQRVSTLPCQPGSGPPPCMADTQPPGYTDGGEPGGEQ